MIDRDPRNSARLFLSELLRVLIARNADALLLSPSTPPSLSADGGLVPLCSSPLTARMTSELAQDVLSPDQLNELRNLGVFSVDLAELSITGAARGLFTINAIKLKTDDSFAFKVVRNT